MVTAGPTFESIDPVRFIGNHSSGKMGYAIVNALVNAGADVILISGPVQEKINHPRVKVIQVVEAEDMFQASVKYFSGVDAAILCAAVADFTPDSKSQEKLKRKGEMILKLEPTKDIAAHLGKIKKKDQILVGFALETIDEKKNALKKLKRKNLDFIVLNSLKDKGAGFKSETNKITIIDKTGEDVSFPVKDKKWVAEDIIDKLNSFF